MAAATATKAKKTSKPAATEKATPAGDGDTVTLNVTLTKAELSSLPNVLERVKQMLERSVMTVASGNETPIAAIAKILEVID